MKQTPELRNTSEKMKPGGISRDGFFGNDDRDLPTLINDHHAQCARLGVTYSEIGTAMSRTGRAGLEGLGEPVIVDGKWEVTADENRGKIPCPFPHPGVFQKTIYTVKNLKNGKTVRYTELSAHLVERHGFFQGNGAPFYNSPATLVEVLEIEKQA